MKKNENVHDYGNDNFCVDCGVERPLVLGDADRDGEITTEDATELLKYIAGYEAQVNHDCGDVNGDDIIDIGDAVLILQYIAGYNIEELR
jgi:hypothetical protein